MDFQVLGKPANVERIAARHSLRDIRRLRRLYGEGRWRKKKPRSSATSTRARTKEPTFVVCLRNEGYEASLERNKIYRMLPDRDAQRHGQVRVVDESGEDCLFDADRFVAIEVPAVVRASILAAWRRPLSSEIARGVRPLPAGRPSR
jgi:hypothetical protein